MTPEESIRITGVDAFSTKAIEAAVVWPPSPKTIAQGMLEVDAAWILRMSDEQAAIVVGIVGQLGREAIHQKWKLTKQFIDAFRSALVDAVHGAIRDGKIPWGSKTPPPARVHKLHPQRSNEDPHMQRKIEIVDRLTEAANLDEFEAVELLDGSLYTLALIERLIARVSAKKPGA